MLKYETGGNRLGLSFPFCFFIKLLVSFLLRYSDVTIDTRLDLLLCAEESEATSSTDALPAGNDPTTAATTNNSTSLDDFITSPARRGWKMAQADLPASVFDSTFSIFLLMHFCCFLMRV